MVRLLLCDLCDFVRFCDFFQSHNGAIAAKSATTTESVSSGFQSHNGAIAASAKAQNSLPLKAFNPTMVRLLLARA